MLIAIYSKVSSGDWSRAHLMVIIFTVLSALVLYTSNKLSKRIF